MISKFDTGIYVKKNRTTGEATFYNDTGLLSSGGKLLGYILFVLVAVSIFQMFSGNGATYSFSGFLQFLGGTPKIDISWMQTLKDVRIKDDWSIFNGFRNFLNTIMDLVSFITYVVTGAAQLLVYAFYVLDYFVF